MAEFKGDFDLTREDRDEKFETISSLRENKPIHDWWEPQGNVYSVKPTLRMALSEDGEIVLRKVQLKGMARKGSYFGKFRYGKDYLMSYIEKHLLVPLDESGAGREQIESIVREALDDYFERKIPAAEKQEKLNTKEMEERAIILAGITPRDKPKSEWNQWEAQAFIAAVLEKSPIEVPDEQVKKFLSRYHKTQ